MCFIQKLKTKTQKSVILSYISARRVGTSGRFYPALSVPVGPKALETRTILTLKAIKQRFLDRLSPSRLRY